MACNFTYDHYIETVLKYKPDEIFIRHDVDMSLDRAVKLAELEFQNDIKATYFISLTSPYYNPLAEIDKIRKLTWLGHDIGLHYDLEMSDKILVQVLALERLIDSPIDLISCHNPTLGKSPTKEFLEGLNGVMDCRYILSKYISDSGQNWREGCFCQFINKEMLLQVNTHPEWWSDNGDDWFLTYSKLQKESEINTTKLYNSAFDNIRVYYDKLGIHTDR